MKSKEIVLFIKKKWSSESNLTLSDIEELAESLIEFSIKVRRCNLKKQQPQSESKMKSQHLGMLIKFHVNKLM